MVRLATSSMFFHEYPIDEVFDYADEAGLDTIEFWAETPHFWLRGLPVAELCSCIRDHPCFEPVLYHAPILDLNPCSINPRVSDISVEYTIESLLAAEECGASVVTVHPGRRTAKRPPSEPDYRRFEHYLMKIRNTASGLKAKVAVENMEKKINSLFSTPESVRELLDREPWLSFTLDVSHALGEGPDVVTSYIDLCADRMVNVHLGRANDGKMHLPVEGSLEIEAVLHQLADAGYDGTISFEIEDMHFPHQLSSEEKVIFLRKQADFVRDCLCL
jgi:sugar phosphate isomerase/epimerase